MTLAHFAVHFLGKRFKDKFIPMMVGLYIFAIIIVMVSIETTGGYYGREVPIAVQQRVNLFIFAIIYSLLLTPSIKYICFVYLPVYMILAVFYIKRHETKTQYLAAAYSQGLVVTFWYILQKRELKRFYEQHSA